VHAAFKRAGSAAASRGGGAVGNILSVHQDQSQAMLGRQFSERGQEFGKLDARGLIRLAIERICGTLRGKRHNTDRGGRDKTSALGGVTSTGLTATEGQSSTQR
jgi:hypothetical protein